MRYGGGMHWNRPVDYNHNRERPVVAVGRYRSTRSSQTNRNGYSQFSSEARQAPASNDTCYVFPWSEAKGCYEVAATLNKQKSQGQVDERMINDLFREIHTMRLCYPKVSDPMIAFAIVFFILWFPTFLGYLFSGIFTTYYNYEIKVDDEKRYIEAEKLANRYVEILIVSLVVLGIGFTSFILLGLSTRREHFRILRRAFILKRIVSRHQDTTFDGTDCVVTSSELGAYIKIQFSWRPIQMGNPRPAVGTVAAVPARPAPQIPAVMVSP